MKLLNVTTLPNRGQKFMIVTDVLFLGNHNKRHDSDGNEFTLENAENFIGTLSTGEHIQGYVSAIDNSKPDKPKVHIGAFKYRFLTYGLKGMRIINICEAYFGNIQTSRGIAPVEDLSTDISEAKRTLEKGRRIGFRAPVSGSREGAMVIDSIFAIVEYDECYVFMGKNGNYRCDRCDKA